MPEVYQPSPILDRSVQHKAELASTVPVSLVEKRKGVSEPVDLRRRSQIGKVEGSMHRASIAQLANRAVEGAAARQSQDATLENLEERATTDSLTGLRNRNGLAEDLARIREHAEHTGKRWLVGCYDLDRVKLVNDTYGHSAGDKYIQAAAGAIQRTFYPNDNAYRIGGDEFVVLLEANDISNADEISEGLRSRLATNLSEEAVRSGVLGEVSGSFGVSIWDPAQTQFEVALQLADASMYRDKRGE